MNEIFSSMQEQLRPSPQARAALEAAMTYGGAVSGQYALWQDGEIVLTGEAGTFSRSENRLMTGDELYGIGSVSKIYTTAAVMKLVGFAAVFLPLAVMLGFRREELVAILVMLGSATTVSCFVMAKNMGHEGVLTSSTVMLTTMFSAFTVTGWLYILRSLALV